MNYDKATIAGAMTLFLCLFRLGCESAEIEIHTVETEYQNGRQEIRVLTPDTYDKSKRYRVLYVLPVGAGLHSDGLGVLKKMDAHNLYHLIIVEMSFEKEPWFGDHAVDPKTRQASYVKEFVVPFIEQRYSTLGGPEGRLLIGFSKSGRGAFSLILTYPEFFGYAASWDAPIFFSEFHYGMKEVYGTPEQLDVYRPDLLIPRRKEFFQDKTRLVLTGETLWGTMIPTPDGGSHTAEAHQLFDREGVRHVYNNNLAAPHRWDETWMAPALAALVEIARQNEENGPESEPGAAHEDISAVHDREFRGFPRP